MMMRWNSLSSRDATVNSLGHLAHPERKWWLLLKPNKGARELDMGVLELDMPMRTIYKRGGK